MKLKLPSLKWVARLTYIYLALMVFLWFGLRIIADEWSLGTLFLYGPRWICLLPLLVLIPLAIKVRSWKSIAFLAMTTLVIVGPIMGGTISPQTLWSGVDRSECIRILTCNTDGEVLNRGSLRELIAQTKPDIVALQEAESPETDTLFPPGWHVTEVHGGLRIASHFSIEKTEYLGDKELGAWGFAGRYLLKTPYQELVFVNLHLPTPREGFEQFLHQPFAATRTIQEQTASREHASRMARKWLQEENEFLLIAGDFNMPDDSAIYRTYWGDFTNAFASAGWGWGYTKQTRWFGARIDHLLAGKAWRCERTWVGPDVGSDHRPMIADWTIRVPD
jgi:vancomycin resistance protein VanJ